MTANLENIHEIYNIFCQKNRMNADEADEAQIHADFSIQLSSSSEEESWGTEGVLSALLFHCDFYTLLANPGDYDGVLLGKERNVAIY